MAVPTVSAASSFFAGTGDVAITLPAHAANDILLLFAETQAVDVVAAPSVAWTEVADSPQSISSGSQNSRLTAFWLRAASSSETNPTITDPGNHCVAGVITITGCITTGNPWNVTAGGTHDAGVGIALTGDTTTVDECLCIILASTGRDTNSGNFSNWANADLTDINEVWDFVRDDGNGGGIGVVRGTKATAGAVGSTTVDIGGTAGFHGGGHIFIAFKPPTVAAGTHRSTGSIVQGFRMGFNQPPNLARR